MDTYLTLRLANEKVIVITKDQWAHFLTIRAHKLRCCDSCHTVARDKARIERLKG